MFHGGISGNIKKNLIHVLKYLLCNMWQCGLLRF